MVYIYININMVYIFLLLSLHIIIVNERKEGRSFFTKLLCENTILCGAKQRGKTELEITVSLSLQGMALYDRQ